MIKVYVPATSANVGAGFDALGLALGMGNTVAFEEAEGCHVLSLDGCRVPDGEENLVYAAAKELYRELDKPFSGLALRQENPIPMTRGLGSSSACLVAGLMGANALLGHPCGRHELLQIAARREGHPDNVAPAMLGGLVASCLEEGALHYVKKEISPMLVFGAFVPDFELSTAQARAVLPNSVPHADAVFNLSRAALLQAALCEGRMDLLRVATQDRLHQSWRLPLIPGGEEIFRLAEDCGAAAVFISGAGPTILAVVETREKGFWAAAKADLEAARRQGLPAGRFELLRLEADNAGARQI